MRKNGPTTYILYLLEEEIGMPSPLSFSDDPDSQHTPRGLSSVASRRVGLVFGGLGSFCGA